MNVVSPTLYIVSIRVRVRKSDLYIHIFVVIFFQLAAPCQWGFIIIIYPFLFFIFPPCIFACAFAERIALYYYQVLTELPLCLCVHDEVSVKYEDGLCPHCQKPLMDALHCLLHKFHSVEHPGCLDASSSYSEILPSLSYYLKIPETSLQSYLLNDKILNKYCMILDIVDSESQRSCCFTKGYAHYVEGTGSVVHHNTELELSEVYSKVQELPVDDPRRIELLRQLQLRYFTPEEIAKLMCFPDWFSLPQSTTNKQRYKVLGNSINVLVVTSLLLIITDANKS